MTAEMVERLASARSSRGRFLAKAGAATLAAVSLRVGAEADTAHAWGGEHGCNLCNDPYAHCNVQTVCWWCWWGNCHINPGGTVRHRTQCCEGYKAGQGCAGGCPAPCSGYGAEQMGC